MWPLEGFCVSPGVPIPQCKKLALRCWGSTERSPRCASYMVGVCVCDLGMGGVAAPRPYTDCQACGPRCRMNPCGKHRSLSLCLSVFCGPDFSGPRRKAQVRISQPRPVSGAQLSQTGMSDLRRGHDLRLGAFPDPHPTPPPSAAPVLKP